MADPFAEQVVGLLEPLLGPHTAPRAMQMVCQRLGRSAESLTTADTEAALAVIIPIVRNLLGRSAADTLRAKVLALGGGK